MRRIRGMILVGMAGLVLAAAPVRAEEDPYLTYVRNAPEFKPVRQDPAGWTTRWDTWIYMPWRYQWAIGEGDEGGQFCRDYGFIGGFTDHGDTGVLPWLDKWGLKFYNDHTASKGWLYLDPKGDFKSYMREPRAVREGGKGPAPLNGELLERLKKFVTDRVNGLTKSPMRIAYALDDEISVGSFRKPIAWRVNDDDNAYETWLAGYYGKNPPKARYVSPDFVLDQHDRALKDLDFSPLLDRITYNDSVWANFLGSLVECANTADPDTPCGFVGSQSPNMWGGFDYAKLTKKIQFVEAYLGTAQSIIRSLGPVIPQVTTHFHNDTLGTPNDIWQTWWCLAHGNRGMIGWVEGWFDGKTPRKWLAEFRDTNREVSSVQGLKVAGAKWIHDGVALYYSQPSIQVSWCLDIEPHGKTWTNRNADGEHGTWHLTRKAWELLLADSGVQYNWVAYDEVVVNGVPKEYKALILPACYALSDIEAKRIREFCEGGGTVVADFACGIFDQHGKGRSRGALDDLFGVTHDGSETKKNFFDGKLWVETDQDAGFGYASFRRLFDTLSPKLEGGFAVAEKNLPVKRARKVGKGMAVHLNLSPQRYHMYREEGKTEDAQRAVFMGPVLAAGVTPWVRVTSGGRRPADIEATYFTKNGRTWVFVVQNARVTSTSLGDTKTHGLGGGKIPVEVELTAPVRDVVDERAGKKLGDGAKFAFEFNASEAVFFSFAGAPPGK
ncbi:MAG: beta-galactosidase trimerization domain-containing protein [Planctomycetota bacterium]